MKIFNIMGAVALPRLYRRGVVRTIRRVFRRLRNRYVTATQYQVVA